MLTKIEGGAVDKKQLCLLDTSWVRPAQWQGEDMVCGWPVSGEWLYQRRVRLPASSYRVVKLCFRLEGHSHVCSRLPPQIIEIGEKAWHLRVVPWQEEENSKECGWVVQNVTVIYSVKLVLERAFDSSICCVITDHVTFQSRVGRFDLCAS